MPSTIDLTVVIPTRDREERLLQTLSELQTQNPGDASGEILVVDNGERGGLSVPDIPGPLEIRMLREPRPGAAAARNRGIASSRGTIVLFLGDDTPPATERLLAGHLQLHSRRPDSGYAVLGRVEWDPRDGVTEFMEWLSKAGFQFNYDGLAAGPVAPSKYLFTAHVSMKRRLLERMGGFDERLPYLFEDLELGIRLEDSGGTLDYHPELLVYHRHRYELEGYAQRMDLVGQAGFQLRRLRPERTPGAVQAPSPKWRLYPFAAAVARPLLHTRLPARMRERAWTAVLMDAYARGYLRAQRSTAS
jgi:GT2 family glycosyltransferase